MIHLNIEGKSWPEVTEQLANLVREHQVLGDETQELNNLQGELAEAKAEIKLLRDLLDKSGARILDLEDRLKENAVKPVEEAPDKNPTPAAEIAPDTSETAAPTEPANAPEDAPAPATETEQPKYDKVQVREFLAGCREKGVNITDVLKPFGGRFPAVKGEDYPELMAAAKKALAEKGAK